MSTENAIARRPVVEIIKSSVAEFAKRLPAGVDATKWVMQLATVVQKNPALLECDPGSLLLAAYEAAELGISLSLTQQHGYIVPYGKQAQFQIGYRGLVQKAYESKVVKNLFAEVVYSKDQFNRQFAPVRNLFHAPPADNGDRGEQIGAYAFIEFIDGHIDWEYMSKEQIERRKNHSKNSDSLMWNKFWEEGWRKTPIRVLAKRLPISNEGMEKLLEVLEKEAGDEPNGTIEIESTSPIAKSVTPGRGLEFFPGSAAPQPAAPAATKPLYFMVDKAFTIITGNYRPIEAELPSIGAKFDGKERHWSMASGRAHELLPLCDSKHLPYIEVDEKGQIVGKLAGGAVNEDAEDPQETIPY